MRRKEGRMTVLVWALAILGAVLALFEKVAVKLGFGPLPIRNSSDTADSTPDGGAGKQE